jgi:murein L,D-transpeptidase YafK
MWRRAEGHAQGQRSTRWKWLAPLCLLVVAELSPLSRSYGADRAGAAMQRAQERLAAPLGVLGADFGAPVFLRAFKREGEMELWLRKPQEPAADPVWVLLRSYPICAWSGVLGPKLAEGDGQTPEGIYSVRRNQLNPASQYHLSFNLGFPNAFDRAHGRTGSFLMVHGACVSIGCYAMTDVAIEEIYSLVAAALANGQTAVPVHLFPFRLEAAALAAEADSPWYAFWAELAPIYRAFEVHRVPPEVCVRDGRYGVGPCDQG